MALFGGGNGAECHTNKPKLWKENKEELGRILKSRETNVYKREEQMDKYSQLICDFYHRERERERESRQFLV